MNYAEARERKAVDGTPTGLFDWTTQNDEQIWRSPPCTEQCAHSSAEDASRHFYDFSLESAQIRKAADEQRRCVICGAWSNESMGNVQMWLAVEPQWLCEKHLNREGLEKASPFTSGIKIIHS